MNGGTPGEHIIKKVKWEKNGTKTTYCIFGHSTGREFLFSGEKCRGKREKVGCILVGMNECKDKINTDKVTKKMLWKVKCET